MKFRLELFIVVLFSDLSFSQFSSLDVNMDARSIAMGESFVANPNGLVAADDNPATLISQKGLSVFYNRRNTTLTKEFDELFFYSGGAALQTTYGNFSFIYKYSKNKVGLPPGIECPIFEFNNYHDYIVMISYANNLIKDLSIGFNVKTYSNKTEPNKINYIEAESNNPILFDIGVLYQADGFINSSGINDKYNLGASLLNYGTDYKEKVHSYVSSKQDYIITKLPRLLKLAFAYQLNISSFSKSNFLKLLFTGEYSNLLNSYYYSYNTLFYIYRKNVTSQKDFWGAGFEATVMDILSLRIGGTAYPFDNYYGFKGDFGLRYGAGINLPFSLIVDNFPLHICFDYAVMITKDKDNPLDAFNLSMNYENPFFWF